MSQFYTIIALVGIVVWTGTLIFAHIQRLQGNNWETNTISHYLTGKDGKVVDIGFYVLATGLSALGMTVGPWAHAFYLIGALGTIGAAVTRAVWPDTPWHIRSAAAAFGGIGIANILASIGNTGMLILASMAIVVALVTWRTRQDTAIQEKSVASLYVVWIGAVTISRLLGHPLA